LSFIWKGCYPHKRLNIKFIVRRDGKDAKEKKMQYVERTKEGDIILKPGEFIDKKAPNGLPVTSVTLIHTGCAIHWFSKFLSEKTDIADPCGSDGRVYRVSRQSDAVLLEETRDGGLANAVMYSLREVPKVLEELRQL
jgi:hypothetical protein